MPAAATDAVSPIPPLHPPSPPSGPSVPGSVEVLLPPDGTFSSSSCHVTVTVQTAVSPSDVMAVIFAVPAAFAFNAPPLTSTTEKSEENQVIVSSAPV